MSSKPENLDGSVQPQSGLQLHKVLGIVLGAAGILLLLLLVIYLLPFRVDDSTFPNPAADYDEAQARIEAVQSTERSSGEINPVCFSSEMTHGEKTEKAIVLYHGFTSCPEQFRELGEVFFEQGYNVYIPRLPYHGHSDQMSEALLETSAEELAVFASDSIDIARGLGEDVTVAGLSGGGTVAAWIAQKHMDVDTAVMIAPFLGIGFIPAILNRPLAQIADHIPNIWMWWDPQKKEENPFTQSYQYPRYPLHALAEYLRLGFTAELDAAKKKPGVNRLIMITNENDESVNNSINAQFVELWQKHDGEFIGMRIFGKELGLPHDVITPTREDGDTSLTYPVIIDAIIGSGES